MAFYKWTNASNGGIIQTGITFNKFYYKSLLNLAWFWVEWYLLYTKKIVSLPDH